MRSRQITIRPIGNSQGFVIPKPILAQLGLDAESGAVRKGWAEVAKKIAEAGDDEFVMDEFANAHDAELAW